MAALLALSVTALAGGEIVRGELAGLDATAEDEQTRELARRERVGSDGPRCPAEAVGLVVIGRATAVEATGRAEAVVDRGVHGGSPMSDVISQSRLHRQHARPPGRRASSAR